MSAPIARSTLPPTQDGEELLLVRRAAFETLPRHSSTYIAIMKLSAATP
jgi:hypothetical protein